MGKGQGREGGGAIEIETSCASVPAGYWSHGALWLRFDNEGGAGWGLLVLGGGWRRAQLRLG